MTSVKQLPMMAQPTKVSKTFAHITSSVKRKIAIRCSLQVPPAYSKVLQLSHLALTGWNGAVEPSSSADACVVVQGDFLHLARLQPLYAAKRRLFATCGNIQPYLPSAGLSSHRM
jgi:hypothetical protein